MTRKCISPRKCNTYYVGMKAYINVDAGSGGGTAWWVWRPTWPMSTRSTKRRLLFRLKPRIKKAKVQVRAKVEHSFRITKCQFGYVKVRFRVLAKNTAQFMAPFSLSNLWLACYPQLTNSSHNMGNSC